MRGSHLEALQGHVGLLVQIQVDGGQAQVVAMEDVHTPNLDVTGAAVAWSPYYEVTVPILVEVSRDHCPGGREVEATPESIEHKKLAPASF